MAPPRRIRDLLLVAGLFMVAGLFLLQSNNTPHTITANSVVGEIEEDAQWNSSKTRLRFQAIERSLQHRVHELDKQNSELKKHLHDDRLQTAHDKNMIQRLKQQLNSKHDADVKETSKAEEERNTRNAEPENTAPLPMSNKYVTFERNFGRLNNQLISVATAFEAARLLNRTVFVQSEHELFDSNCRGCQNVLIGVEDNLWDMEYMRRFFRVLTYPEVLKEYGSLDKHPVLGKGVKTTACTARGWPAPKMTVEGLKAMAETCDVINVGGNAGPTQIAGLEYALNFFQALRPAPYLKAAADDFLKSIDWGTASGLPRMAVHSRIFWEGRHCKYGFEFCTSKVSTEMHRQPALAKLSNFQASAAVAHQMCYPTPKNLNLVLKNAGFNNLSVSECDLGEKCQPWLLATDTESGGNLEFLDKKHGAKVFDINQYRKNKNANEFVTGRTQTYGEGLRSHVVRTMESSFADLYLLSRSEIFLGNVYSTFTATVCKARNKEQIHNSNCCSTLTGGVADKFFTTAAETGLPDGWKQHWNEPETRGGYKRICQREFEAEDKGITLKF
eukprot:m.39431 g.39431  ORF g.39431 m.39431 type:complete len:558 (-) comp18197_c0_seq1:120-1793(-)